MAAEEGLHMLEEIKECSQPDARVELVQALTALIANNANELVPALAPQILDLRDDPAAVVVQQVLNAVPIALTSQPLSAYILNRCLSCLAELLNHTDRSVLKQAVVTAYPTFLASFNFATAQTTASEDTTNLINTMWALLDGVSKVATASESPISIKLSAIKFAERTAALLNIQGASRNSSSTLAGLSKAEILRKASTLLQTLISMLKAHLKDQTPGPLAIGCIQSAGHVALQYLQSLGRLLPPLLTAATSASTGADGAITNESVKQALRNVLLMIFQHDHPLVLPWRDKIRTALYGSGGGTEGAAIGGDTIVSEDMEGQAAAGMATDDERQAKRQKVNDVGMTTATHGNEEIEKAVEHMQNLIQTGNGIALATYITTFDPTLLADVVIARMSHLPPTHIGRQPGYVPQPLWMQQLVSTLDHSSTLPDPTSYRSMISYALATSQQQRLLQQQQQDGVGATMMDIDNQQQQYAMKPVVVDLGAPPPLSDDVTSRLQQRAVDRVLEAVEPSSDGDVLCSRLPVRLRAYMPVVKGSGGVDTRDVGVFLEGGGELAIQWLYELFVRYNTTNTTTEEEEEQQPLQVTSTNSPYTTALVLLLNALKPSLPTNNKTLISILSDAPALPIAPVVDFLKQVALELGSDGATLALIAAREILKNHPTCRKEALEFVLRAAVSGHTDVRNKAVKLVTNQLFTDSTGKAEIVEFSRQCLLAVGSADTLHTEYATTAAYMAHRGHFINTVEGVDKDVLVVEEEEEEEVADTEQAAAITSLYCALCTKDQSLLQDLFETYGTCTEAGKTAIVENVSALARAIQPTSRHIVTIMHSLPTNSLELVLLFLDAFSTMMPFPQPLLAAVVAVFDSVKDPRVFVPAISTMDRSMVLTHLLDILELSQDDLKSAFRQLLVAPPYWNTTTTEVGNNNSALPPWHPALTATELLVALHTAEGTTTATGLKKAMKGINVCLATPELFEPESIAATINQLLTRVPLPALFMRTVIQTLAAAPSLRSFVMGVMGQLISKQIWRDNNQWKGWIMCAKQLVPDSYSLLVRLPAANLQEALKLVGDGSGIKEGLREYVTKQNGLGVASDVMALLQSG